MACVKVLLVDDSRMVRMQLASALAEAGFQTVEAGDGVAALEMLRVHPDVAAVVLDLNMPRMSGLEVLERLQEEPPRPVVVLTVEGRGQFIEQARHLGAKAWMIKPVPSQALVEVVRRLTGDPRLAQPA